MLHAWRLDGRNCLAAPTATGQSVGSEAGSRQLCTSWRDPWLESPRCSSCYSLTCWGLVEDALDIERGATSAGADASFELALSDRSVRVPVPGYRMPDVPKLSAGYYAAPDMDLIDLFIGSEGTLGIVTEVTLRILAERRRTLSAGRCAAPRAPTVAS